MRAQVAEKHVDGGEPVSVRACRTQSEIPVGDTLMDGAWSNYPPTIDGHTRDRHWTGCLPEPDIVCLEAVAADDVAYLMKQRAGNRRGGQLKIIDPQRHADATSRASGEHLIEHRAVYQRHQNGANRRAERHAVVDSHEMLQQTGHIALKASDVVSPPENMFAGSAWVEFANVKFEELVLAHVVGRVVALGPALAQTEQVVWLLDLVEVVFEHLMAAPKLADWDGELAQLPVDVLRLAPDEG